MKRKYRKKPLRKLILIILFIAIIPSLYLGKKLYRYVSLILQVQRGKKEVMILKAENEVLQERIDAYKKGILLEARARDDLGMIKKGEKVYLIKNDVRN